MAALCNRAGHIYFRAVVSSSSFFSSPNLSGCLSYFHTWCGLSVNLECRSETCCARLGENTARQKSPKSRYLGTIPQLCQAISSQLRHVSTIGKKLGELRPTSGWDRFVSLGHHCKFQPVSRLTARHSSSGRQSNCGVEQRATPVFGRAAITLGIRPHF